MVVREAWRVVSFRRMARAAGPVVRRVKLFGRSAAVYAVDGRAIVCPSGRRAVLVVSWPVFSRWCRRRGV
jgi:hypothetical protein